MENNSASVLQNLPDFLDTPISSTELQNCLTADQITYLTENWSALSDVELIWQAMDREWDRCGAGYQKTDSDALKRFYGSPVWLLNGIFTDKDPRSAEHRDALTTYVVEQNSLTVADFGGGFGSFSRKLAEAAPNTQVSITEPFPSALARKLTEPFPNLRYCDALPKNTDIIVAQDVLEHVTDPLGQFAKLLAAVRFDGLVITANCFQPVIKCHFPGAYHLHKTFRYIAPYVGCKFEGSLPDAPHIEIYRKTNTKPSWHIVRTMEAFSRAGAPAINFAAKLFKN